MLLSIQPLRWRLDGDRDPDTRFRGAVFRDVGLVFRLRELRLLALAALTLSAVQMALVTFAVTMLVEDVRLDLVTAGIGLAVVQVAGVFGRLGWGVFADRCGNPQKTLIIAQVLSIIAALVTTILVPGMPLMLVFTILFMFGVSAVGWNGVFMAEVARLAPRDRIGSATGGVLVPVFIGVIIGPMLFTGIHQLIGQYTLSFFVAALITAIGIVPMLLINRKTDNKS